MSGSNDWPTAILTALGIGSPTPTQRGMIAAWIAGEGTKAANNPLATTQAAPGATNFNNVGVKNYPTFDTGLKATVATLTNGYYKPIIQAIQTGDTSAFNNAVISSPWGTKTLPPITPVQPVQFDTSTPSSVLSGIASLAAKFGISQPFGPSSLTSEPSGNGYAHYHNGIDIPTPQDTPVYALSSGTITAAGADATGIAYGGPANFGTRILQTVGNGFTQLFGHLSSVTVTPGQRVQAGQLIGYTGSTGNSTGPHLHIGLYQGGTAVDPFTGQGQLSSDVTQSEQATAQWDTATAPAQASPYMLNIGLPLGQKATIDLTGPMRILWLLIGLFLVLVGILILNKNGVQKIVATGAKAAAESG